LKLKASTCRIKRVTTSVTSSLFEPPLDEADHVAIQVDQFVPTIDWARSRYQDDMRAFLQLPTFVWLSS
jgi:hypothetical protein